MRENKNIPFRNYFALSIILILSIIVVIYFYMWYGEIKANMINISVMDKYLNVINYNELDAYLVENKDVVIYASASNDTKVRNFEKRFREVVDDYSLNSILYLNLSEEYNDKKLFDEIISKYDLLDLPCIIIFKGGLVDDVYSIDDINYDTNLLVNYLRDKGVIYD